MTVPEEAKRLFLECFDSNREEAEIILDYAQNYGKIDILYQNGEAANMVCRTKLSDKGFEAEYIFAACTNPDYRKQGLFRKQLEELSEKSPLVLIPENESLFPLYEHLGFEPIFCLEAEIIGNQTAEEFKGDAKELYGIYKNSSQFPKKDFALFNAAIKAHISYGGAIKITDDSAILVIDGKVLDIFAPNDEEAVKAAESALNGRYKALFPISCIDILEERKIKYCKKSIAMGKNLSDTEIYINTLFN